MEDDKLKYSDIIQPDGSIEKLIKQLSELNQSYETLVGAIKTGADKIVTSLKTASGATKEGRKSIDEATVATSRLERAQNELKLAMTDTGKQIAWLKAQTVDQNKATVEQQRYLRQMASSYDKLNSDLKQAISLYKSLTEAEREDSAMGQQLLQSILGMKSELKALDNQMRPHIQTLTEVQKAEQKLAYLQSEEGQRLLELRAKIADLSKARSQEKSISDSLTQAQEKLAYAQSEENQQLKLYSTQIREANQIAKYTAIINSSAEGSYNRLSAQYALNKIKLNQMSQAEREAADSGKKLEAETAAIYQQMIKLQEATGNYKLSVGHYQKAWDGLGFSISQVVRELPAAAVSLNTFFLGISNNIPMVVDEINKLRAKNKLLQEEGKQTVSITRQIVKSLFGWNTALVILLTVFSMFGQQIITWIGNLFKGRAAAISFNEALENITKELENTNASYGSNIVSLKQLQSEWKNLATTAEKNQWIIDNKSEFDKLGVAVNNVTDAENIFIDNTEAVINALKLRAKASAAQKLAAEEYEKALVKRNEAETEAVKGPSFWDKFRNQFYQVVLREGDPRTQHVSEERTTAEKFQQQRIKDLKEEAKAAEATGDAYFDLAAQYEKAAKTELKAAGISSPHKTDKSTVIHRRAPRDLTDTINRNAIKLERQYEESITKLQNDEFAKRRKNIADQIQDENNKLREMYRKNESYIKNVDNKYKELTESQKKQIEQQQDWINKTISNNLKLLAHQLSQIQKEQQINSLQIQRETINSANTSRARAAFQGNQPLVTSQITTVQDTTGLEQSLIEERKLMSENLDLEYALIIDSNKKLLEAGDEHARSEEEIIIELNKKKLQLWAKYDQHILDIRKQNIEDQIELVKKGSKEELELLLEQNEIARQAALTANASKPATQQVSSSIIESKFDKSRARIQGQFQLSQLDEQQALDEAIFNEVERSETEITRFKLQQEKSRWEKQIELAEAGSLDWSQTQIDTAKATIKGIDRELSKLDNFVDRIGEKGLGKTLLESLGFNDKQIDALSEAANIVIEQFQAILDAEVELAEKAVEAAQKRVEAAQSAYEAEVEARNNGYANNVADAKRELQVEQKRQKDKQKLLEAAKNRQEKLNTVIQASSLITASANLWSAFSSVPLVGPALAIAAIATMWASFAAAKVKAKQVSASESEEYGEGGLEFLEGGSHASGNDIDLGTRNKRKRRMKAEGGEALAIVNKKQTRKYSKILPDIVNSLNKGVFEDKYLGAFEAGNNVINVSPSTDLSNIEKDLRILKIQNNTKYYSLADGTVVSISGNVKRIMHR